MHSIETRASILQTGWLGVSAETGFQQPLENIPALKARLLQAKPPPWLSATEAAYASVFWLRVNACSAPLDAVPGLQAVA